MPLSRFLSSLLLCAGILALVPAQAHGPRASETSPRASLQAQAVAEVAQDTVRITLAAELADASRDTVSETLAATLQRAMARAKAQTTVKVTSGNTRIWPMNDREGRVSDWRGLGEIHLESTDFDAASRLAASLGDGMAITSVSFFVSARQRALEEQALLTQAAEAFQARAQALALALGYDGYRLRSVELGGSGAQFEMAPRAMQAQAIQFKAADSVPLEGGTEMVTVSVQGSVWLLRDDKATPRP